MNCLRSLERWDRGFEFHLRHGCLYVRLFCACALLCLQVTGLRRADPMSKVPYRLCIGSKNWKGGQGPTNDCRAIIIIKNCYSIGKIAKNFGQKCQPMDSDQKYFNSLSWARWGHYCYSLTIKDCRLLTIDEGWYLKPGITGSSSCTEICQLIQRLLWNK
jgi:hypothetical protein